MTYPILSRRGFVLPTRLKASAYEAGGSNGSRTRDWRPSSTGPSASVGENASLLRSRSRGAVRNDPWAKTAVSRTVSNLIGTGIQPHPQCSDPVLRKALKLLWDDWAPYADADGILDVYGQQTLGARALIGDGEYLVQKKLRKISLDLPVPIQFRLLEGDHLEERTQSLANGAELYRGIYFDADNQRTAYSLWNRHPGEYGRQSSAGMRAVDVPAAEISHVFEPLRPGQARGVTELATVLLRLHSLDNFDDAVLFRQEVANLFAGFITKPEMTNVHLDSVTGLPKQYDSDGFTPISSLEPGTMQELLPGEEVAFATPPGAGNDYGPFMRQQLMATAAAVDMPYEVLTGDLRDVSDRALRVILNEFRRRMEQRQWNVFIPLHCRWIWSQWLDAVALSGVLDLPDYRLNKRDYMRVRWVPQGWPYIHPLQDVQAQRLEIRAGLNTRSDAILKRGENPEAMDQQNAEDNARADSLGLMFDSDARQRDLTGNPLNPKERKSQ